ncbi:type IV pilus assembly protein PilN [Nitrosomonas cryotolerans]|uniref:Type IV pilus assembly protein PilN n=1 Tax=Nitrosomonas cryotolerans ATCC 49181 TaxID=1131553 RepID=A0A1N6HLT4_9PROT|nr:PilN domain-containing protein [Nitrosomonas cryotolerans]SFP64398.1 type IV pilus assembly protein PilN [Nitrosomonas cryotolerans]SIO20605.1 type IV pilus assembly protein PilN [Nitrosomonas cryotolerans ATCC 49181]
MIRINLLPHRELKRKIRRQQIILLAGITGLLGIAIVWGGHIVIMDKIEYQNNRNQYMSNQIALLDKQIEEIKQIKSKTQVLLVRKGIVETLQSSRAEVVHLLDQLARLLPDGVHLHSVKQEGRNINLVGYAQSNAWVSRLMRNLESSEWLQSPSLIEIKAVTVNNARLNEFNLNIQLLQPSNGDIKKFSVNDIEKSKG